MTEKLHIPRMRYTTFVSLLFLNFTVCEESGYYSYPLGDAGVPLPCEVGIFRQSQREDFLFCANRSSCSGVRVYRGAGFRTLSAGYQTPLTAGEGRTEYVWVLGCGRCGWTLDKLC